MDIGAIAGGAAGDVANGRRNSGADGASSDLIPWSRLRMSEGTKTVWDELQVSQKFFDKVDIAEDGGLSEVVKLFTADRLVWAAISIFSLGLNLYVLIVPNIAVLSHGSLIDDDTDLFLISNSVFKRVVGHHLQPSAVIALLELLIVLMINSRVWMCTLLIMVGDPCTRWHSVSHIFLDSLREMQVVSGLKMLSFVAPSVFIPMLMSTLASGEKLEIAKFILWRALSAVVGFDAFVVKFNEAARRSNEVVGFAVVLANLSFLNQMLGVIQVSRFMQNRLLIFIFGGEDGEVAPQEMRKQVVWEAMLAQRIWVESRRFRYPITWFCSVMLCFGDYDFQMLTLNDHGTHKKEAEEGALDKMYSALTDLGKVMPSLRTTMAMRASAVPMPEAPEEAPTYDMPEPEAERAEADAEKFAIVLPVAQAPRPSTGSRGARPCIRDPRRQEEAQVEVVVIPTGHKEVLSNFFDMAPDTLQLQVPVAPSKVRQFANAEAAFQALKFWQMSKKFGMLSGEEASQMARSISHRADFTYAGFGSKWRGMLAVLDAKYAGDTAYSKALLATGDAYLLAHCSPGSGGFEKVWSDGGDGSGLNWLGLQLMLIRDKLTGQTRWSRYINSVVDIGSGSSWTLQLAQRWQDSVRAASATAPGTPAPAEAPAPARVNAPRFSRHPGELGARGSVATSASRKKSKKPASIKARPTVPTNGSDPPAAPPPLPAPAAPPPALHPAAATASPRRPSSASASGGGGAAVRPSRGGDLSDRGGDVVQFLDPDGDQVTFRLTNEGTLDYLVNGQLKLREVRSIQAEDGELCVEGRSAGPWGTTWYTTLPEGPEGAVLGELVLHLFQRCQGRPAAKRPSLQVPAGLDRE